MNILKNPYQIIGDQFAAGLAHIESNLKADISFDELNELVYNFVQPKFFPNSDSSSTNTIVISFSDASMVGLNLEITEGAYFQVLIPMSGIIAYTKAKKFIFNATGVIVTSDTNYILLDETTIPSGTSKIFIFESGAIKVELIASPGVLQDLGQIVVAKFMNPAGLQDLGNGYYLPTVESGEPIAGTPGGSGFETSFVKMKNPLGQPDLTLSTTLKAMGSNAVLEFNNNNQINSCHFINLMINGLTEIPIESIGKFLENVQENIGKSGLTDVQTARCYMAVASAIATYNYWIEAIANPANNWYNYSYFSANENSNRASIPYWVAAAINGVALGSSYDNYLQLNLNPKTMQMAGTLMGGLTLASSMVIYKLVPNI